MYTKEFILKSKNNLITIFVIEISECVSCEVIKTAANSNVWSSIHWIVSSSSSLVWLSQQSDDCDRRQKNHTAGIEMSASTCRNLQSWKNAHLRSNINVLYHENHATSLRTRLPFLRYSSMRRRSNHAASSSHLQLQSTCQRFDQNKLCKHFWLFEDVLSPEWEVQKWLISLSSDHVREQRNELNTVALQSRSLTAVLPEILRLESCNLFCYWLSWREDFLDLWLEIREEWRNRIEVARLLSRDDFVLEEHLIRRKSQYSLRDVCVHSAQDRECDWEIVSLRWLFWETALSLFEASRCSWILHLI